MLFGFSQARIHYLAMCAAIGFNVETVTYKNIKFQVWDLGGQTSIRPYWRCYYPNTQAIIYVVDSSDTDRIGTSAAEFHAILGEDELKEALILVYANKQVLVLDSNWPSSVFVLYACTCYQANGVKGQDATLRDLSSLSCLT